METGLHARKIWIFTIRRAGLDCCARDPPLFARIVASQRHYNVHYRGGIFRFRSWILLSGAVDGAARFGSESSREMGRPSDQGAHATFRSANGTNRKNGYRTNTCDESLIAVACHLCNTLPKTACPALFRAVPLLRVQKPSVIVMLRRRGASRGRPVIGGSLKSLAFMRECPKARSG